MTLQTLQHYLQRPLVIVLALVLIGVILTFNSFIGSSIQDQSFGQVHDLRSRIEDLKKIKRSINVELKQLADERSSLMKDKASLLSRNEKLLSQIGSTKLLLRQLELDILANKKQKSDQSRDDNHLQPIIFNPLNSIDLSDYSFSRMQSMASRKRDAGEQSSDSNLVIDHSLCPLTKKFGFFIRHPSSVSSDFELLLSDHKDSVSVEHACFEISLVSSLNNLEKLKRSHLPNNLIVNLIAQNYDAIFASSRVMNSILASPQFLRDSFRNQIDIVIPSILQPPENFDSIIGSIPPHSPLERKYLASYFGHGQNAHNLSLLEEVLQTIHRSSADEAFLFIYNCNPKTNIRCYEQREMNIGKSMFLIILPVASHDVDVDSIEMVYQALLRGTIPVIVGKNRVRLPFDEVVDWRRATISIPEARLSELHFLLKSISPSDLYLIKYHGRRIFENYLATSKQIVETLISIMRIERFNHPPPPIPDVETLTYNSNNQLMIDTNCSTDTCIESKSDSIMSLISSETLGPREYPFASPAYRRNFSLTLNFPYDLWNSPLYKPNYLFPSLPTDPIAPSEYKFITPGNGYRPIAEGQGGSGAEFSRFIGGDYPNEQFTIVLLTHERKTLLMRTLERLKGTAYLNKVIVVWNGINQKPSPDYIWPNLEVPLHIVKVERNSLNNRFLPFNLIETDAIFSMDDDSPLRPDEIVFAFRVWRQSRDRIVGFPGRFHAWDNVQNAWVYNSNHSCELSMVLTGGAFFHKYYTYIYSYFMPESIRTIVDRFMNCEDIAFNFLVAHLTRKPPIKVTSRWTFHCSNCWTSLSEDDSHFKERHECLNMFASIYGYMPLLNTQHRSDSILFKTRLPKDKQKCFRFV